LRPHASRRHSDRPQLRHVCLARPLFHLKSAVVGLVCLIALVLLVWSGAARAQTEVMTATTTTTITTSINPVAPDGAVTFTARVAADRSGVPGGSIDFFDEATMVCLGRADVTSPSITVANLAPGAHPIRAYYTGTTAFLPFVALPSFSAILIQTVQAQPRLEVSTSQNPSGPGATLTLLAIVSAESGTPTGTVTFRDGDRILAAKVMLDRSGRASFVTSALSDGAHAISAEYEGDALFARVVATVRQDVGNMLATGSFRIGQIGRD
jgi:Big-like domain-containing protein